MRLVVTGASGFIGRQIIPILQDLGVEILAVDRSSEPSASPQPNIEYCDYRTLAQKGKGADGLLHLAALKNSKNGSSESFHMANVDLLHQVIESCKVAKIPHLIYTGCLQAGSMNTSYARSKLEAERVLSNVKALRVSVLRLPPVYGDDEFQGKLGLLKNTPLPFRSFALQLLRSIKPTLHVNKLADAIYERMRANHDSVAVVTDRQAQNWFYAIAKKLIDVTFAISVIIFLGWLLILVWLLVKLTSNGPGVFAQERVGRNGTSFTLYKFRTMAVDTKQAGTHEVSSSSVTSAGRLLRKTKIDELPQVLNILKGDLSLVGPRPCLPSQTELIDERNLRGVLDILPGVTGYAQVRGIDMSNAIKLAKTDETYVNLRAIPLDIDILLQTARGSGSGDRTSETSTP